MAAGSPAAIRFLRGRLKGPNSIAKSGLVRSKTGREQSVGKPSYPSDLNETEGAILDPLIPRARKPGRPEKQPKRAILNAIFYLVRSGCAWRMRPNDLPPWKLVWHCFSHWKKQGVWERLNDALRDAVRLKTGKKSPHRCDSRRAKCAHNRVRRQLSRNHLRLFPSGQNAFDLPPCDRSQNAKHNSPYRSFDRRNFAALKSSGHN
jgi:transposase